MVVSLGVPIFRVFTVVGLFAFSFTQNNRSIVAGPRGAVGSMSDSRARGRGFDTRSGIILSFLLPLV